MKICRMGIAVVQLVQAMRHKKGGPGIDSLWGHLKQFQVTLSFYP
jgi:hypothetical protein